MDTHMCVSVLRINNSLYRKEREAAMRLRANYSGGGFIVFLFFPPLMSSRANMLTCSANTYLQQNNDKQTLIGVKLYSHRHPV